MPLILGFLNTIQEMGYSGDVGKAALARRGGELDNGRKKRVVMRLFFFFDI